MSGVRSALIALVRNWVLKGMRATLRMDAYVMMLTDVYPPFTTE